MTKIIPIRPFGKDLTERENHNPIYSEDQSGEILSASSLEDQVRKSSTVGTDSFEYLSPPMYDYTNAIHKPSVEITDVYVIVHNVLSNVCDGGTWKQGVWKQIGLRTPEQERKSFPEWNVVRDRVSSVLHQDRRKEIVPSLPLFVSVLAAIHYLQNSPLRDTLPAQVARQSLQSHFFHSGTYTSTAVQNNSEGSTFYHGMGLGDFPLAHASYASVRALDRDLIVPMSGVNPETFDRLMKWIHNGEYGVNVKPKEKMMVIGMLNVGGYISSRLMDVDVKCQAGAFLITPSEFEVIP